MGSLAFLIGALVIGLVLCLPFLLWFRPRTQEEVQAVSLDLQFSLHCAFVEARSLRYETISLEQLLLALLDNPRVVGVLRGCATDIETMRGSLSALVRNSTPVASGTGAVEPQASPDFKRVLERIIANALAITRSTGQGQNTSKAVDLAPGVPLGRRAADGTDALVAILDETKSHAADALRRHGVTRLAVTNLIAHGIIGSAPVATRALPADGIDEVAVVLENDDFTPIEFVVSVLQDHLELDLAAATQVMLDVHNHGRAVCGRFPADLAADKVERVRSAASQAGHPLRCIVDA
jgi:ATP-dependent Clp protease adapter protein ClpS